MPSLLKRFDCSLSKLFLWLVCSCKNSSHFVLSIVTLNTSALGGIFFILFPIHFLRCLSGEFVKQSISLVSDHFLYSHDCDK